MAIRKSVSETLIVDGPREDWLDKCQAALEAQGFSGIESSETLWQVHANFKKMTTWGSLDITLLPEGRSTRLDVVATANVDNLYALFRSPTRKILNTFKSGLSDD